MAMTIVNQPVLNHEWDFCLSSKTTKQMEDKVCECDIYPMLPNMIK